MLEQLKMLFGTREDTAMATDTSVLPVASEPTGSTISKGRDLAIAGAFIGAIALLLVAAGYVISRISSERAYNKKWEDYDDCGWA